MNKIIKIILFLTLIFSVSVEKTIASEKIKIGLLVPLTGKNSEIGHHDTKIDIGCNILSGVKISNSVSIGKGCLIYYNSIIIWIDLGTNIFSNIGS